jgi:hypothetical protein
MRSFLNFSSLHPPVDPTRQEKEYFFTLQPADVPGLPQNKKAAMMTA